MTEYSSFPDLLRSQAERTPDAVAAVWDHIYLSYGELESRANQLAQRLCQLGVGPEVLVGLF
ncbi:MAG: AMP-binding protein, partial [Ktedonobacteraceae bacterium]|nr:AMP-binding protein [Ktedonobacteraceae bacterium]